MAQLDFRFSLFMSSAMHRRLRAACKASGSKMSDFIRGTIAERIEYVEAKLAVEEARRHERRTRLPEGRRAVTPVKPIAADRSEDPRAVAAAPVAPERQGDLPPEYDVHATKIYEAIVAGDSLEKRVRVGEAVADIKRRSPLSHPSDGEIVAALEGRVRKLHEAAAATSGNELRSPTSPAEEAAEEDARPVERIIDPTRIRTFGDVL